MRISRIDGGSEFHVDESESANDRASCTGLTFDWDVDLILHVCHIVVWIVFYSVRNGQPV